NFMKHWDKSALKKFAAIAASMGGEQNGMQDYMQCWASETSVSTFAGTMTMEGAGFDLSMVFDELNAATMKKCAETGGYTFNVEPDGKFAQIIGIPDGMGGTTDASYYFVAPDTVLFSMSMDLGGIPKSPGRAELESFLASAKENPASNSAEIKSMIEKSDRSKSFWFAGSAAGTPLSDKLNGGQGWLDMNASGISIGFAMEFTSADIPKEAAKGFSELKSKVGSLPEQFRKPLKKVLSSSSLKASGRTLSGKFTISNSVMEELIPAMQMMGGF
ncbi:MAG: hypothetical protein GY811_28660, partial [Myxococcales bacterium]|nr:hypothetical protein [Myxococcales bacterium]